MADSQAGGKGEPFNRDPDDFEKGLQMIMQLGREVHTEKWGHRDRDFGKLNED